MLRQPQSRFAAACLAVGLLLTPGCARQAAVTTIAEVDPYVADSTFLVPGDCNWVDTGVKVQSGEAVTVLARGTIVIRQFGWRDREHPCEVGPEGTFFFSDDVAEEQFPLPSAARGPAPCYCLLGRIGDGPPLYIGSRKSWLAEGTGTLKLGINDYDVTDNTGRFYAQITKPGTVQPVAFEQSVSRFRSSDMVGQGFQPVFADWQAEKPAPHSTGQPAAGSSVVAFYVDGLRPDVIREMVAMGHLPNIRKHFVEGGVWLSRAFTAFPSDTATSNGTMWTGCFSDRHGLKGQVRFSRRTLHSESYLEPLGPNRSARLLAPSGIDKLVQNTQAAGIGLVKGDDEGHRWRRSRTTDVSPLYEYLRSGGEDWATGTMPVMTEVPPLLWTRSLVRHLPYLHAHDAWKYIDDANVHYALRHLLGRDASVTIIWLPETDSVSHKLSRGQFGMARRTIAQADVLIGRVVEELAAQGRLQRTYLMLLSDHGHHGGRKTHLSHFDIANQLFYRPREMSADGEWIGGGLGLSVRQHRSWNRHRGDSPREFVFIDGDAAGAARIFLPRGHYQSGRWDGPFHPADLLEYRVADHLPPLNLVESLAAIQVMHADGSIHRPIDLVLMKLSEDALLIATAERGQAVIQRKRNDRGRWTYKYTPVRDVVPTEDGEVEFRVVQDPQVDPLGLLDHLPPRLLDYFHDEQAWLRLTAGTQYPDSVVSLSRHMLWQEGLRDREREYAPDLVVTARRGWYFGVRSSPGTAHGYPFADSMRATWFVSGPNIRRGARIVDPCRLADLTPTILEMVGIPVDPQEFDGVALRTIYKPAGEADGSDVRLTNNDERNTSVAAHPVYWEDIDLDAWQRLDYTPLPPYEHLPVTVNRPYSPLDLNNVAYNLLSIGDWNVFRIVDDVLFPLSRRKAPITGLVERADQRVRRSRMRWLAEGAETLDIPALAVADYSLTSLGNLKRGDRAVDWVQQRSIHLNEKVAGLTERPNMAGTRWVHTTIDTAQYAFWEVYRLVQRLLVQVVDETILNGIEDGSDRAINSYRLLPAEIIVEEGARPLRTRSPGSAFP